METNENESVTQPDASGASTENNVTLSKADLDFKRDMLRYKDEANLLKEQLKEIGLEKEQKKGNFESVITTLKDEIKSYKQEMAQSKYNFASTQLDSAIMRELTERGLKGKKLDAFMKLVDDNDKSIVSLDDRFNVDGEDIKSLVDKNMERYGDLFKKEVKIVDGVPARQNHNNVAPKKSIKEMTIDEAVAYAKTLKD